MNINAQIKPSTMNASTARTLPAGKPSGWRTDFGLACFARIASAAAGDDGSGSLARSATGCVLSLRSELLAAKHKLTACATGPTLARPRTGVYPTAVLVL